MTRSAPATRAPAFLALACVGFVASAPAVAAPDPDNEAAKSDDQDSEPPVNASGDKGAEGPGDQAEGEDDDAKA